MATAAPPHTPARFETGIRDPLLRLRRAIRAYIVIEGLARMVIWAGLWCWVTFLIDYGFFQLFNLDYVRDGSQGVRNLWRGIFIPTLVAGLGVIVYQVVTRLAAALREQALALVLERRFPGILGDRLVTAVELADRQMADRYGYSWPMVEETQHGAAERLEKLDVRQVLNRQRQAKECAAAGGLALAFLVLALFATDAAAIWFERDVRLERAYWPKRTIVELISYPKAVPHGGEARIEARTWKWVVATRTNSEGWRPLEWEDIDQGFVRGQKGPKWDSHPLWKMEAPLKSAYWRVLPEEWKNINLDQVEARLRPDVFARFRREIGLAVIKQFNSELSELLPPDWRALPTLDPVNNNPAVTTVQHMLEISERLTPPELQRYLSVIEGNSPTLADAAFSLNAFAAPILPPIRSVSWQQKVTMALSAEAPETNLSERDRYVIPPDWKKLPAKALVARLHQFAVSETPEAIGDNVRLQLLTMFDELEHRADQKSIGRRRTFRTLFVPEEVTVEFAQIILNDEERLRTKPKVGTPKVRRAQESNDYSYDFKKVERPLQFRVLAGDTSTAWLPIQVKPIPTLKQLTRRQDELGYLHGSNSRIQSGPFPVSLEGSESRFDVPAGTRLTLAGECYKDLTKVRAVADLAVAGGKGSPSVTVQHEPETKNFHIDIGELTGGELRLRLELDDTDGITGRRDLVITVIGDKPPEFQNVRFEVVNHKMITPQAVLPFSGLIHDDHGLMDIWFDAVVEKDQKVVAQKRLPMLHFLPLSMPDAAVPGGRFEKWEDVTAAQLLAGPRGEEALVQFGVARLPAAGPTAWLPVFFGNVPRNYAFQYRERPGGGAVLGGDDEFLDTMLLRPIVPEGAKPPPWIVPPYRLRVSIGARDNCVVSDAAGQPKPAGQESINAETFEFTVVDEADLLIEAGKREEDLRDRCEEIIANLKKARTALQRLRDEFPTLNETNEFRRAIADGQDLSKALRAGRDGIDQKVLREFRQIYRELTLNRCRADVLDRINSKICGPLELILQPGQHFERADEALDALLKAMDMDKAKTAKGLFTASVEQMDRLISRLDEILIEMKKLIEFNQALTVLREIIKSEEGILQMIKDKYKKQSEIELDDKKP